jgi:hypothetical protein
MAWSLNSRTSGAVASPLELTLKSKTAAAME